MADIKVRILGDASSLEKSFRKAGSSGKRFEKDIGRFGRGGVAASGAFRGLGRSVAFASTSFLGGVGIVAALKSSVGAAQQAQVAQAQLRTQLRASGISYKAHRAEISKTIEKQGELSGFLNDDLTKSFTGFVRRTGNVSQALKLNAVATDIARAKGKDLVSVQQLLVRALAGNARAATSLGLPVVSVTKHMDALRASGVKATAAQTAQAKAADKLATGQAVIAEAQKRFGGQAAAFGKTAAGAQERFKRSLHETEVTIGNALLPTLTKLFQKLSVYLNKMNSTGRLQRDVKEGARLIGIAFHIVADTLGAVIPKVQALSHALGGAKNSLKLLAAAFIAFKFSGTISRIGRLTNALFGFTKAAKAAKAASAIPNVDLRTPALGKIGKLRVAFSRLKGSLAGKAGIAGVAVAAGVGLSILIRKFPGFDAAAKRLGGHFFDLAAKIGLVHDATKQFTGKTLLGQKGSAAIRQQAARLEAQGLSAQQAADKILAKRPDLAAHDVQVLAGVFGKRPQLPGEGSDALSRFVANASTKAKHVAAKTRDLNKHLHEITAAQRAAVVTARRVKSNQLFDALIDNRLGRVDQLPLRAQLTALAAIAALLTRRIKATKDITRKLKLEQELFDIRGQRKDAQKQLAQNLIDARTARQFRELGLTSTGDQITPGVANLKKRLGSVSKAIQGTFLDTNKTKSVLARIRKVLSEGLVPKDVRAKLKEMLDGLTDELKNHQQSQQTKFRHVSTNVLLSGLGLSPEQFRKAQARLAQLGAGNTLPGQGSAAFAGAGAGTTTVNTTVNLDGKTVAKNTTQHQRKIKKRRSPSRRGPYAGNQ